MQWFIKTQNCKNPAFIFRHQSHTGFLLLVAVTDLLTAACKWPTAACGKGFFVFLDKWPCISSLRIVRKSLIAAVTPLMEG